jgi:hypothetical protein
VVGAGVAAGVARLAPGHIAQLGGLGEGGGVDGEGGRAELVGQEVGEGLRTSPATLKTS